MGGTSTQSQTQNSTTNPWEPATGTLRGILTQANSQLGNVGLNSNETQALNTIVNNSQSNPYAATIGANATGLLNGGGANDQAGLVNANYQRYVDQTNPLASNTNYNPYDTPGFRDAINTMTSDITNSTNGQFAAAGRDFSGANLNTLARGLTSGLAPTIASQYNQNISNQQGAAGNLYNAGNTTANTLAGFNTQANANRVAGTQEATNAQNSLNSGANNILTAENYRNTTPTTRLGLLANIGTSIGSLGGQSTGTSNTTNQMSGAQQFGTISNGVSGLFRSLFPTGI